MNDEREEESRDLQSLGAIFDGMQGRLFGDLTTVSAHIEPTVKPAKSPASKTGKAITPAPDAKRQELERQGEHIAATQDQAEIAFQARSMMQCTLPHRDPGNVPIWARRNGDLTLLLQPGYDDKTLQPLGLPFGEIPRLLLIWIVTEAVRTKSRYLKLDDDKSTLSGFLRAIGADPGTGRGKRGDAKRVKDQLLRLFSCRISFKKSEGTAEQGSLALLNMEVASAAQLWWDFKHPEQGGLFKSEIILGENFFKAITTNPVPLDLRAVIALKKNLHQSSFALDVYMWITWRVFVMQTKKQKSIRIPLGSLKEQFGSEYKRLDNFKTAFEEALNNVWQVYPAFDYEFERGTFVLIDGKKAHAVRSRQSADLKRRLEKPHKEISLKTREWFTDHYGYKGWSLDKAIKDFDYWTSGEGTGQPIEVRDINKLFKKFVRDNWAKPG